MSIRSVLPLIDYAVNYDYISTQLCENKSKPELLCNGKCYVKNEMAKSEQNSTNKIQKVEFLEIFLPTERLSLNVETTFELIETQCFTHHFNFTFQDFYPEFFHPPLV